MDIPTITFHAEIWRGADNFHPLVIYLPSVNCEFGGVELGRSLMYVLPGGIGLTRSTTFGKVC